jgi:hypothetical protein
MDLPKLQSPVWPANRLDNGLVWVPTADAMMVASGVQSAAPGKLGYRDTWFFRETPPSLQSVSLPSTLLAGHAAVATLGTMSGGYGTNHGSYRWLVNGQQVSGDLGNRLPGDSIGVGDLIQVKVMMTDRAGLSSPWVGSKVVTVDNRPPRIVGRVTLSPSPAYYHDTLHAAIGSVTDPDGDKVRLAYVWKVNGARVNGANGSTLTSDNFVPDDNVTVAVTPTDQWGLDGDPKTGSITVRWNLHAGPVHGDHTVNISGEGFGSKERVDVHLDRPKGRRIGTAWADSSGAFEAMQFTVPASLRGEHDLYGIGRSSGVIGLGKIKATGGVSLR